MERKHPQAICESCPFKDRKPAFATGPSDAKIAVVSRSPGRQETLTGKSFSGPSGKVLDHLLKMQGLSRNEILATNVVLCASEGREDPGWEAAVACCSPRLRQEVSQAETVLACGSEASQALVGSGNIFINRGYPHIVNGHRIIVTNNPAVVLRDGAGFPEMVRDFRLAINPLPKPKLPEVIWFDEIEQSKDAARKIYEQLLQLPKDTIVSCDIEARGTGDQDGLAHTAEIACMGISIRSDRAIVFGSLPCGDSRFLTEYIKPILELPESRIRYLWHGGKYDIKNLRRKGINARVDEDTLLLSWCLDERPGNPQSGAGGHSLEWLLKDELGWPKYEFDSVKFFKKTGRFTFYGPDEQAQKRARTELYKYNGMDCGGCLGLYDVLVEKAKADNVYERPYKFMLIRLSEALTKVELEGNPFDDVAAANILEEQVYPKLKDFKAELRTISKKPKLNPNSTKQLEALLYDDWGIKHDLVRSKIEKKGKRSTDKYVREEIIRGDFTHRPEIIHRDDVGRFISVLDDFKELDTQRGTFFEGLILKRYPDGRLYTDFKIHGTESGRLSSSKPNLQNVTRPKEGLPSIRSAFLADPGCSLISVDLSQAELRAIAVLSGSKHLQDIYLNSRRSLHKEVAKEFYGDNYTYEQYVRAKNINFGVAYWQSAFSFAQLYHMPEREAQSYINFWWNRFPEVWTWTKSIEKQVMTTGELQSPFGHKRRFHVIPQDKSGQLHVVKEGINFLPQNIAGNITLWALIKLCEELDWEIAQVRLNVHDNIVVNCRNSHIAPIARQVKATMEASALESLGWGFPFKAEISTGPNWGNLETELEE